MEPETIFCPFCTKPCHGAVGLWSHTSQIHRAQLQVLGIMKPDIPVDRWETERAELRERIWLLERQLYSKSWQAPAELKLCRQEEALLACLVSSAGYCTNGFLLEAINRGNAGDDTALVKVVACRVRQKLKAFDLHLVTHWGVGYSLDPASRARLLNWNERAAA